MRRARTSGHVGHPSWLSPMRKRPARRVPPFFRLKALRRGNRIIKPSSLSVSRGVPISKQPNVLLSGSLCQWSVGQAGAVRLVVQNTAQ